MRSTRTGSLRSARTWTPSSASSLSPSAFLTPSRYRAAPVRCTWPGRPRCRARATRCSTSTLTFAATANAITYVGATPVFIDASRAHGRWIRTCWRKSWRRKREPGRLPAAVLAVDLYGQCCDYERIAAVCGRYGVPLVEDAAEALGASCGTRRAGAFGACAAFSFNGNKIITTSGGGMLVSHSRTLVDQARHLATQARDPAPHYEHSEIGFNYRMSNLLAAIGRGQLKTLGRKDRSAAAGSAGRYHDALGCRPVSDSCRKRGTAVRTPG